MIDCLFKTIGKGIKKSIDFCIYEKEKKSRASKIIDLSKDEIEIKER